MGRTDADGTVRFDAGVIDGATLDVSHSSFETGRAPPTDHGVTTVRLTRSAWVVRGVVVDPAGRPVPPRQDVEVGAAKLGFATYEVIVAVCEPLGAVHAGAPLTETHRYAMIGHGERASPRDDGTFEVPLRNGLGRDRAWVVLVTAGTVADVRPITPDGGPLRFVIDPAAAHATRAFVGVRAIDRRGLPIDHASLDVFSTDADRRRLTGTVVSAGDLVWSSVEHPGTIDVRVRPRDSALRSSRTCRSAPARGTGHWTRYCTNPPR